jgi:hypothetical protein
MLLPIQDAASARIGQGASARPGRRARRWRARGQPPGVGERDCRQVMQRAREAPSQQRVAPPLLVQVFMIYHGLVPFEAFITAGSCYLLLTFIIIAGFRYWELRWHAHLRAPAPD